MKMSKILLSNVLIISFLLISCSQHPVFRISKDHIKIRNENYIVPYSVNLITYQNLKNQKQLTAAKEYILWVLDNLNYPDKYGLTGSIYDFYITRKGLEKPLYQYDSVDSYSATFLLILYEYFLASEDRELFLQNRKKIEDIAYTIAYLQDNDGLTFATPATEVKYLMDNCEVYAGLEAYIYLCKKLNWDKIEFYQKVKDKLEKGFWQKFYDPKNLNFHWAVSNDYLHRSDWNTFYPDGYAQLFPILFGLLENDENIKTHIWQTYLSLYEERELPTSQMIIFELTYEKELK